MATRCGALDPSLLLYFLQQENMLPDALSDLLYHRSGLFELSGISDDTRDLLECNTPQAREALEVFTLRIAGEIARLASTLGGLDSLIFTAGIGEHQPEIRALVCRRLSWLGIQLDTSANSRKPPPPNGAGYRYRCEAALAVPPPSMRIQNRAYASSARNLR